MEDIVQTEAIVVNQTEIVEFGESQASRSFSFVSKITEFLLYAMALLAPIWFGAIHQTSWLALNATIYALALIWLIVCPSRLISPLFRGRSSKWLTIGFCGFISYCLLQYAFLTLSQVHHPVLGLISSHPAPSQGFLALLQLLAFFLCYVICRAWIAASPKNYQKLISVIMFSGMAVSLIALSHWFYDNGKLFWIFEPKNVFISLRVRWPFVNANHLADFVLPILFLVSAKSLVLIDSIKNHAQICQAAKGNLISRLVTSERMQAKVIKLMFLLVLAVMLLISVIGSLSRAAWLGMSVGLFAFVYTLWISRPNGSSRFSGHSPQYKSRTEKLEADELLKDPSFGDKSRARKRRHRHLSSKSQAPHFPAFLSKAFKPALIILGIGIVILFLRGQGEELLSERLEYGLLYSKDDLRFQLYKDTMPMIFNNLFFGTGLGTWDSIYPKYMNFQLSGVAPEYLHSEPLQLLAETGLAGVSILFGVFVILLSASLKILRFKTVEDETQGLQSSSPMTSSEHRKPKSFSQADYSSLKQNQAETKTLISGLFCGLLALVVASCLDFPFHIPAIILFLSFFLSLLTSLVDTGQAQISKTNEIN